MMTKNSPTQRYLIQASSWMRVSTLRRASTSWLSQWIAQVYFLHHFFLGISWNFHPHTRDGKNAFLSMMRGSNHSAYILSLPSIHPHYWARLLKLGEVTQIFQIQK